MGQAGENVGKAAQNLADSVADNLSGNGNDGILEDYQGKTRNQELGLQSKIDKDLKAAIENLAENPEAAEAQLESLAKKVAKINGVEGDVDIEFYNSEDGAMGGHKDGKIYINLNEQDGSMASLMEVEVNEKVNEKK